MKFLLNMMEKVEPMFSEGGKLAKFHPVYDGLYTFAFTPGHTTKKGAHIRDGVDLKRTMFTVIVALIPCLLFGMLNTGHFHYFANPAEGVDVSSVWADAGPKMLHGLIVVLPLLLVSYGVGLGVEFVFCIIKGHSIQEGFLVSGMLIPLILPANVPLWTVALATIFAVLIGKEVFGGTGMNIVNVALTARAFLFFGYPTKLSGDKVWYSGQPDGYSGETVLGQLAKLTSDATAETTGAVSDWMVQMGTAANGSILGNAFMGAIPGSIGETSVLAILIGAGILLFTGVGSLRIMLSFVIGGAVMGLIFNGWEANGYMEYPWYMQLMVGGFAFGAVFMATDPVTASQTPTGKIIYGFLGGFLAIMIRVFNPAYPEGVMLAILFMNIMAPLIDHYVVQSNVKKRLARLKTA